MDYIDNYQSKREQFYVDSESDITNLPTHAKNNVGFYSKAIVADTGNVYILKETDEWVLFGGEG